jgi:starch synthase (maltosyl-transferring)
MRDDSLAELIARVNAIRHAHPALQSDRTLRFHPTGNDALLAYSKTAGDDRILVVANLDPWNRQAGVVELPLHDLALPADRPYRLHDLVGDAHYTWQGAANYVELDPHVLPAHVLRLETLP